MVRVLKILKCLVVFITMVAMSSLLVLQHQMFTQDHLEHLAHHQVRTPAKAVTHQVHKIVNSTALMLQQILQHRVLTALNIQIQTPLQLMSKSNRKELSIG